MDSCTNQSTMPDQVHYTLRMQEYAINFACLIHLFYFQSLFYFSYNRNGLNYYRAHRVKLFNSEIRWKRAPEDFCQGMVNGQFSV